LHLIAIAQGSAVTPKKSRPVLDTGLEGSGRPRIPAEAGMTGGATLVGFEKTPMFSGGKAGIGLDERRLA
jgi:hypothetical protein